MRKIFPNTNCFKKMTCKKWPELGIQVSGTIFDAAVIGFKWGKTF